MSERILRRKVFSNDHNISILRDLVLDVKEYAALRAQLLKIDVVQKMTMLVTALIVGAVLVVLAAIVVLFLSLMVVHVLTGLLGSAAAAYGVVGGAYLLIALLVYFKRQAWIAAPVAAMLGSLLLADGDEEKGGMNGKR
ncbi:MAG: hypothetical protein J1F06_04315 [Prevotellaceae bacterium]|nr:hypothetical protein [Prevotellaceae bacterium]